MPVYPGVYVSSLTTDDWRPDAEVGGEMHVLVEEANAYAGLGCFVDTADPEPWILPQARDDPRPARRGADRDRGRPDAEPARGRLALRSREEPIVTT